ncbi:hypothetical protein IEQ34_001609 [Dendrobium chrysotoxum]|uniref:Uncharacterized protein n=1 Tax=Dendrobium chrysotoxum TaxID=161865 RepID=A0AAV7HM55_DENCH|nr:hypothetical protein IEQ34_001609 [Dendrobium chrysotoxum]
MSKSFEEAYVLIEVMVKNNFSWPSNRVNPKRVASSRSHIYFEEHDLNYAIESSTQRIENVDGDYVVNHISYWSLKKSLAVEEILRESFVRGLRELWKEKAENPDSFDFLLKQAENLDLLADNPPIENTDKTRDDERRR